MDTAMDTQTDIIDQEEQISVIQEEVEEVDTADASDTRDVKDDVVDVSSDEEDEPINEAEDGDEENVTMDENNYSSIDEELIDKDEG